MMISRLETLNEAVTDAMLRADRLADDRSPKAGDAYRRVAEIEAEIAKMCPAGTIEGDIARRGVELAQRRMSVSTRQNT